VTRWRASKLPFFCAARLDPGPPILRARPLPPRRSATSFDSAKSAALRRRRVAKIRAGRPTLKAPSAPGEVAGHRVLAGSRGALEREGPRIERALQRQPVHQREDARARLLRLDTAKDTLAHALGHGRAQHPPEALVERGIDARELAVVHHLAPELHE